MMRLIDADALFEAFSRCKSCGCCLFDEYFHDGFDNEEQAIAAWNRRANLSSCENVQCQNCKHADAAGLVGRVYCMEHGIKFGVDEYCSRYEKYESDKP